MLRELCAAAVLGLAAGALFAAIVSSSGWFSSIVADFATPRLGIPDGCRAGCVILVPIVEPIDERFAGELLSAARNGGVVVVLDEGGFAEQLYDTIGIRISRAIVRDPVMCFEGDPGAVNATGLLGGEVFHNIYLYEPRAIKADSSGLAGVLVTSEYSYLDVDGDGVYDWGEPIGSWVVGVLVKVGRGLMVVVADTDFISDKGLNIGANRVLLDALADGEGRYWLVLDAAGLDDAERFRAWLSGLLGSPAYLRALAGLAVLVLGVAVVYWVEPRGRL